MYCYAAAGQVAGQTESFGKLHFASVRNAGHMVPYTQPERAYTLFTSFIENQALPT